MQKKLIISRVVVTERCNASCPHCFNADMRKTSDIDADRFIQYLQENGQYYRSGTGQQVEGSADGYYMRIMGGEPLLHPRIKDILIACVKHIGKITIFTNGRYLPTTFFTDPELSKIYTERSITLTINGFTMVPNQFDQLRNSLLQYDATFLEDHRPSIHYVIPFEEKDGEKMMNRFQYILENSVVYPEEEYNLPFSLVNLTISPDSTVNVFDKEIRQKYQQQYITYLTKMLQFLHEREMNYLTVNFDHSIPPCFFSKDMILQIQDLANRYLPNIWKLIRHHCDYIHSNFGGLLYSDFDLYYCNQTRIKLGSLLRDDGTLKNIDAIGEMYQIGLQKKLEMVQRMDLGCKDCPAIGGCLMNCFFNTALRVSQGMEFYAKKEATVFGDPTISMCN